jgi:hypothetical protein
MKAIVFPDQGGSPRSAHASGPASHPETVAASLFSALN